MAVVAVQAASFHEDFTADVHVRVVSVGRVDVRDTRIERALIATTRFDAARGVVYLTRSEAGIQNVYAYPLATGKLRRITNNARPGIAFSGVEPLAGDRLLGVTAEHQSDIWIGERER